MTATKTYTLTVTGGTFSHKSTVAGTEQDAHQEAARIANAHQDQWPLRADWRDERFQGNSAYYYHDASQFGDSVVRPDRSNEVSPDEFRAARSAGIEDGGN